MQVIDHCLHGTAGVEHIVDQEHMAAGFHERLQQFHAPQADGALLVEAFVGAAANRKVLARHAEILEHFLHGDANRRAATPQRHQQVRLVAALDDFHRQFIRVHQ